VALHDARRGDAPAYDRARFGDGLKGCCALHKRDNQPRRDQGVYASKGDAEIQTAHDVLILELVLFAGATVSLGPVASAAHHGNGEESPPVGLASRAGFRMNISTSRARPALVGASLGTGGCRADMTDITDFP
jgi:hypothetical protein